MTYRILSLDGGGIRGVYTTTLLSRLEAAAPFLGSVDLFAGTSTGGIIALGLAAGLTPEDLTDLYLRVGPEIFPDSHLGSLAILGKLLAAPYDNAALKHALTDVFGQRGLRTLGDLPRRVLVPTFDLDSSEGPAGKSRPLHLEAEVLPQLPGAGERRGRGDRGRGAAHLRRPDLLPELPGVRGRGRDREQSIDGRTRAGAASGHGGQRPEDVRLLSVGTGDRLRFIPGERHDWGFVQWAMPLAQLIVEGPMDTARYECEQLLDERFHRLDAPLERAIELDDAGAAPDLVEMAKRVREPMEAAVAWVRAWFT